MTIYKYKKNDSYCSPKKYGLTACYFIINLYLNMNKMRNVMTVIDKEKSNQKIT